jgi:hypothetical protein
MVRRDDLDRLAQHLAAEILHRHGRGSYSAHAGDVGVDARHVLEHADFHDAVGDFLLALRGNNARQQQRGAGREGGRSRHRHLPCLEQAAGSAG